jgi:hypothetical protein
MDPLEYLITVLTKIELMSKLIEVKEEQAADWLVRATAFEEQVVVGMSTVERRAVEKRIRLCRKEAERVEEQLKEDREELEELEDARVGLERAGVRL